MNWSDERYVRVYTRDTMGAMRLGWDGRALFREILCKVDRAGILSGYIDTDGLAALLRMPAEVVSRSLPVLLRDGCISIVGEYLVVRNYIEAQEADSSSAQRQRDSRERSRAIALAGEIGVIAGENEQPSHGVTKGHTPVTKAHRPPSVAIEGQGIHHLPGAAIPSHPVTNPPEPSSRIVTNPPGAGHSVPYRTVPKEQKELHTHNARAREAAPAGAFPDDVLAVWEGYRTHVAPNAGPEPTFPDADEIGRAIRREGDSRRLADAMRGNSLDEELMGPTSGRYRTLRALLTPDRVRIGLDLAGNTNRKKDPIGDHIYQAGEMHPLWDEP